MAIPSRYRKILTDEKWGDAFGRKATIDDILAYVLTHWQLLQKHPPADLLPAKSEPTITKFFGLSLRKNARAAGVTGYFVPENPVADINEIKQELESRGRTDLTYFSDNIDPPLDFVFEFKKLKSKPGAKSSRLSYYKDGVRRFVDGIYGREAEFGFMVALVASSTDKPEILHGLKQGIQNPDMEALLKMIKDAKGNTVVSPANSFTACHFETAHGREHVENCADIVLGHIILCHGGTTPDPSK